MVTMSQGQLVVAGTIGGGYYEGTTVKYAAMDCTSQMTFDYCCRNIGFS